MSTLRVNKIELNDTANAYIAIGNTYNVSIAVSSSDAIQLYSNGVINIPSTWALQAANLGGALAAAYTAANSAATTANVTAAFAAANAAATTANVTAAFAAANSAATTANLTIAWNTANAAVTTSRSVSAGGIATGGGDFSADRTITVTKATGAEVTTGTNDTKAVTPKALADAGIAAATGTPAMVLCANGTATTVATLDIVFTTYVGLYRGYRVVLTNLTPETNRTATRMRFSTDGGSTFLSSNYSWSSSGGMPYVDYGPHIYQQSGEAVAELKLNYLIDAAAQWGQKSAAGSDATYIIDIFNPEDTTTQTTIMWIGNYRPDDADYPFFFMDGQGFHSTAQDTDAVRFYYSSGNIATVSWALYGYK